MFKVKETVAGAVVAIGVIVFPIMLSLGISKHLATGSFAMSVGCALYFNSSLLKQAAGTMLVDEKQYDPLTSEWYKFAGIALTIHLIAVIIMVCISVRKEKRVHAWAATTVDTSTEFKNVNWLACLTPILPVSLTIAFGFSTIVSIILAVIWALGWTGYLKKWKGITNVVEKTFYDGVSDVGLVLGFLLFLQMFVKAASSCKGLLAPIISPILPSNTLALFVVFGILGFLALFPWTINHMGCWFCHFRYCCKYWIISSIRIISIVLYPLLYNYNLCLPNTIMEPLGNWL